jgi:phytoene dehydrogenase-like protein
MLVRVSTYSADLARLSAVAALRQFRSAKDHGVIYLDGGWQSLVDGLEQRARRLGVEIRTGVAVEGLSEIDADGIVLAVPPAAVERIAGGTPPRMHAASAACLDIALRRLPEGAARVVFGVDRPLYFSVHSAVAKLAPEGGAVVHVAKYLGEEAGDRAELEAFADRAMPGWQDEVEVARFLPRMTVTPAVYGVEGRPDVDALGIEGVALAGDWVGSEGMLADAAVASGLRAAAVVQRQKQRAA